VQCIVHIGAVERREVRSAVWMVGVGWGVRLVGGTASM
jgi:hypothetical protein